MNEFIDTYSDDQIMLRQARIALLTHPLMFEMKELVDASFCRLFIILMIGSIESMLKEFLERDEKKILEKYFARNIRNGDRIHSLRAAFETSGINVKEEVFNQYLAAKYLRNTIVHASWENNSGKTRQYEVDWIEDCGFPTDTRKLTEKDLMKLEWVHQNMMLYIAIATTAQHPRPDLEDVGVEEHSAPDVSGVFTSNDWTRAHWNNLDRISSEINTAISNALISDERYIWTTGLSEKQRDALTSLEVIRANYSTAYKAAQDGCEYLASLEHYGDSAAFSWRMYRQHSSHFKKIKSDMTIEAFKTLEILHNNKIYPRGVFPTELITNMPPKALEEIVGHLIGDTGSVHYSEIAKAISAGEDAYYAISNITPLSLFACQLPIIAPARLEEWSEIFNEIKAIWQLGRSWYSYVERRESPDLSKLELYTEMVEYFSNQN